MDELESRLRKLFGELFQIEPEAVTDEIRRGEIDAWDSLGHLDLVGRIEQEFSLRIETERALDIETFSDARRIVAELLGRG